MLKTLFVLAIFIFCPDFFGLVGKRLDKKLRLILKFMTSQTGKQIIIIHTLRSKGVDVD